MPLIRVDTFKNYSDEQLKTALDIIHQAAVNCFQIPDRDRYQIITQHAPNEMVLLDTNLGFTRSKDAIVIQVFSRKRSKEAKLNFYRQVATELTQALQIKGSEILISLVENGDADWSFGWGEAQFVSGKL
ncbi:tautomerase family protein [Lactobacillus sp. W8089]|nr:tautomerase family protein [Lactobacillus sp. W8086]MBI0109330.1 tautomerase family protein [Lactobacillus sp. W8085]MBI0112285.1 tautomerase family protein [Lactobacillus sp. W8088]MBI0116262.1 tautomerase family protein [Lactobacillus sp. W8087]MBI0119726.1 tautomerase family protein [Lactobacillus sp. W8089]MBI0131691.1 tautomerase family protein [Lactobacillus sp. W8090]MCT6873061.1 tautomerase family protein [Bombilactobacillus mellis]